MSVQAESGLQRVVRKASRGRLTLRGSELENHDETASSDITLPASPTFSTAVSSRSESGFRRVVRKASGIRLNGSEKEKHKSATSSDSGPETPVEKTAPDAVIPFSLLDSVKLWRLGVQVTTLRINAVLDPEQLHEALKRLFELDGWRKLGARIRVNAKDELEHHLPACYDEKRPAFTWSHVRYGTSINDNPLTANIPTSGQRETPTIFRGFEAYNDFVYPDYLPRKFEDWTVSDKPPLTVHLVSFRDATLISMSFSHTVLDAIGLATVIRCWTKILAGRENEVPAFLGFDTDPIKEHMDANPVPPQSHLLYEQRLKGVPAALSMMRVLSDFARYPQQEERIVCLPGPYVAKLKAQAIRECGGARLSENDVLFAWRSRLMAAALQIKPKHRVGLIQPFNLCGTLDALPRDKAYTANATVLTYLDMTAETLLSATLGNVAMRMRKALTEQRTPEQAVAYLNIQQELGLPFFGPWKQTLFGWSNWTSAGLFDMDFSPAVLGKGTGKPAYVSIQAHAEGLKMRNIGCVLGKDSDGNWWLPWIMRSQAWPKIEKAIAKMGGKVIG